jgi:hypothetical protein
MTPCNLSKFRFTTLRLVALTALPVFGVAKLTPSGGEPLAAGGSGK